MNDLQSGEAQSPEEMASVLPGDKGRPTYTEKVGRRIWAYLCSSQWPLRGAVGEECVSAPQTRVWASAVLPAGWGDGLDGWLLQVLAGWQWTLTPALVQLSLLLADACVEPVVKYFEFQVCLSELHFPHG